jgi:hypothetical protein
MLQDKENLMPHTKKQDLMQLGQLILLALGVGGFFIDIGKRSQLIDRTDKDLTELKVIVQDLVKAQIQISSNDAKHSAMLDDLKQRVIELERKKL